MTSQFFLDALELIKKSDIEEFDFADGMNKLSFRRVNSNLQIKPQKILETAQSTDKKGLVLDEEISKSVVCSPASGIIRRNFEDQEKMVIKAGDYVEEGTTVCLIEAMKMIIEVKASKSGKIKKFFVIDGELVEYQQKLFTIE